jgi:hypothetical protein
MKMKSKKRSWLIILVLAVLIIADIYLVATAISASSIGVDKVDEVIGLVIALLFASVGGLILNKKRRHVIGWLFIIVAATIMLDSFFLITYGPVIDLPITLSAGQNIYVWFGRWSWWLVIGPIFLVFQLFPSGSAISKKWRRALYLLIATAGSFIFLSSFLHTFSDTDDVRFWPNPIGFIPEDYGEIYLSVFAVMMLATVFSSLASMIVRFRNAGQTERAQLKWLFYATAFFVTVYLTTFLFNAWQSRPLWLDILFYLSFLFIPIAIGIAILRYRLWDIDFVINRSLVFGVLTTLLTAIFALTTSLAAQFAESIFGEEMNQAAAAVAAIFVASIFQPLRKRVESAINRRLFPENVDIKKGLIELKPEFGYWISVKSLFQATLTHLQEIFLFEQASIHLFSDGNKFDALESIGIKNKKSGSITLLPADIQKLGAKESIKHDDNSLFSITIPIYVQRRKKAVLIGLLNLGKRPGKRKYSSHEIQTLIKFGEELGGPTYLLQQNEKYH